MKMRAAILACSLVVLGCSGRSDGESLDGRSTGDQAAASATRMAVERLLGSPLPKTAKVVVYEQQSGMDDMQRVRLDLSKSDYADIAARLPVSADAMSPGAGRLGADRGRWDPHATKGIRSGQSALAGGRFVNVGVAEHGDRVTLFIMEHGT